MLDLWTSDLCAIGPGNGHHMTSHNQTQHNTTPHKFKGEQGSISVGGRGVSAAVKVEPTFISEYQNVLIAAWSIGHNKCHGSCSPGNGAGGLIQMIRVEGRRSPWDVIDNIWNVSNAN